MTPKEFSDQIVKLSKALKPFAMRLTKDQDDANDLMQDTLLKGFTNSDKFTDGTNLKAWMFTIMKNTFITNYQKMVKRNTFVDISENLQFINTLENSTNNNATNNFVQKDITKALNKLEETYLSPFMMYFSGYKYHEIAENLNIPIGTVKNRIHIARKELKHQLPMYA
jgi:RNA polymerase sigma factor (sigma-70 family)